MAWLLRSTAGERDEVASVPQTPAQVTLGVVSAVMAILGAVVLLAGGLVLFAAVTGQAGAGRIRNLTIAGITLSGWSPMGLAIVTLAAGALLCLTAWLGLLHSRDSRRVAKYCLPLLPGWPGASRCHPLELGLWHHPHL